MKTAVSAAFLAIALGACSVGCLDDGRILASYVAVPDHSRVMVEGLDRTGGRACYWSLSGGPSVASSSAWASCQASGRACTVVAVGGHVYGESSAVNLPAAYAAIGAGRGLELSAASGALSGTPQSFRVPRSTPAPVDHSPPVGASYSPPPDR